MMTLKRYRQLAVVTTIGICVLVVAGGVVRLTGSGLGCDDWPNCNAERFIDVSSGHTAIEQVNRLLSGVIGLPTLLLTIVAFRISDRGDGLRWPAVGVLVTILANGVVGGIAVRGDLHPALVQSHFLLAMASIAFGSIAVRRSGGRPIAWRSTDAGSRTARLIGAMVVLTAAALTTGTVVTGAGPHAGDEVVRRFGFDIGHVARIHSLTVIAAVSVAAVLAWTVARRGVVSLQNPLSTWIFVALVQGGIGYTQYFTGVPELLVAAHLAGATLLWVLTVQLGLDAVGVGDPRPTHDRDAVDTRSFAGTRGSVV